MQLLQNLIDVVWALRWVITFAALLTLVAIVYRLVHERDEARAQVHATGAENAELRALLGDPLRYRIPAHHRRTAVRGRMPS